jgi:pimeloyl-ACP methyl ester carboxylesterase
VSARRGCALTLALTLAPALAGGSAAAGTRARADSSSATFAVRGLRLYVEQRGHGPALVLLHGGMGNGRQFANQIPDFAPRFHLVIPDLCGQGRTSWRAGRLTYHDMAEDVIALLDHLHLRRVSVMGWSDGGIVGLDLAIHHPDRIDRLVTFGANTTPDGLNPPDIEWNRTATPASLGPDARRDWSALAPDPSAFDSSMANILAMWRTQPEITAAQLHSIRARVLVCAGEHDVIRPEHTEALARAIPGAERWIVPGASHGAMIEQPALVNARVLEFLRAR